MNRIYRLLKHSRIERNDLLRYAKGLLETNGMAKKKDKAKKLNLLEFSDAERVKLLKEIKRNLQEKIVEAKLWKSLLEVENVVINGKVIFSEGDPLTGLWLERKI